MTKRPQRTAMATLVRMIKKSLKRRETRILTREQWERVRWANHLHDTDIVSAIAGAAGADWLVNYQTGEAHFFEFM